MFGVLWGSTIPYVVHTTYHILHASILITNEAFDLTSREDMCYALLINIVSLRVNGLQTVTLCLNIQRNILK